MGETKGFFYPRTRSGKASVVPAPPWDYSGNILTIEFRTHPDAVAALLPEPLGLVQDDPGAVSITFAEWQSCGQTREELLDPVRAQYMEAYVGTRCEFEGRVFSRTAFIWVDSDAAFVRGLQQGYPKKFGSVWMTRFYSQLQGSPALAAGGRMGATLTVADRRLAETVVTLTAPTSDTGFVNSHTLAHHRYLPAVDAAGDVHAELIEVDAAMSFGQVWAADVDTLSFFDSPTEELSSLTVLDIISATYQEVGMTFSGAKTLWRG